MVGNLTTILLCGFRTDWPRREQAMKTAGRRIRNHHAVRIQPSTSSGCSEHLLLNYTGWKTRKYPAAGKVFLLTFPFIELIGSYAVLLGDSSNALSINWAGNTEASHFVEQGRSLNSKPQCRAVRTTNDPVAFPQHLQNLLALCTG
jgi:hypothetical protein